MKARNSRPGVDAGQSKAEMTSGTGRHLAGAYRLTGWPDDGSSRWGQRSELHSPAMLTLPSYTSCDLGMALWLLPTLSVAMGSRPGASQGEFRALPEVVGREDED